MQTSFGIVGLCGQSHGRHLDQCFFILVDIKPSAHSHDNNSLSVRDRVGSTASDRMREHKGVQIGEEHIYSYALSIH